MSVESSLSIILVRPQLPENMGAVARAMANFGLQALRLVAPVYSPTIPKALAASAGADAILLNASTFTSLEEAVADLSYLYGTVAREREMIKRYLPLKTAMTEMRAQTNGIGILFGPERTGLTNDELALCRAVIHIPVVSDFSSLNLAQAVALTAYEHYQLRMSVLPTPHLHLGKTRPASHQQLQDFLTDLEAKLDQTHYWRHLHKKPIMKRTLRNIFARMDLTEQEGRTLRGMIHSLFEEGKKRTQG